MVPIGFSSPNPLQLAYASSARHEMPSSFCRLSSSPQAAFEVSLSGESDRGSCHINMQTLDRHDGVVIARYRVFTTCRRAVLRVLYRGQHVADSPYQMNGE